MFLLSPTLRFILYTCMTQYGLFVLKVPLNTKQTNSVVSERKTHVVDCVVCYRSLREGRDVALSEKERALNMEKDTSIRYEQLLQEYVIDVACVPNLSTSRCMSPYVVLLVSNWLRLCTICLQFVTVNNGFRC